MKLLALGHVKINFAMSLAFRNFAESKQRLQMIKSNLHTIHRSAAPKPRNVLIFTPPHSLASKTKIFFYFILGAVLTGCSPLFASCNLLSDSDLEASLAEQDSLSLRSDTLHLDFCGIPLGIPASHFADSLQSQGYQQIDSLRGELQFQGRLFGHQAALAVYFHPPSRRVHSVAVGVTDDRDSLLSTQDRIREALHEGYGHNIAIADTLMPDGTPALQCQVHSGGHLRGHITTRLLPPSSPKEKPLLKVKCTDYNTHN